jgi:hypothetical protein
VLRVRRRKNLGYDQARRAGNLRRVTLLTPRSAATHSGKTDTRPGVVHIKEREMCNTNTEIK